MRPRTDAPGRDSSPRTGIGVRTCGTVHLRSDGACSRSVLEEESNPLASAPAQGRRRAVRAQSLAILHKVGCSWSARPARVLRTGSAGPTTRPRFEPIRSTRAGRQTGEPTVSHEGCSGFDSSFFLQGAFPPPLPRQSRGIHPPARRVARPCTCGLCARLLPRPISRAGLLCRAARPSCGLCARLLPRRISRAGLLRRAARPCTCGLCARLLPHPRVQQSQALARPCTCRLCAHLLPDLPAVIRGR